jgi:DNA-binding protein YbaB
MCSIGTLIATAQSSEVKEKPPMYSYVASWSIPRAQWADVAKTNAADKATLDKAVASGVLVGYGNDEYIVHDSSGLTHDNWWSSMSMAGLINVLDQFYSAGTVSNPVLNASTKHWDGMYVSRYYNYKPGAFKGYTRIGSYKLKADAPDDAVEMLSKNVIVPLLEKLFADGTLIEYEVDTQAVHTEDPAMFSIVYVAATAEGLDKVNTVLQQTMKANPLAGPAFGGATESSAHRDQLARTTGVYK